MNHNWEKLTKMLKDGDVKASKSKGVDNQANTTNSTGKNMSNVVHTKSSGKQKK